MNIFKDINNQINLLKKYIPNFSIGKSFLGREIVCFKLGDYGKKIIIQGGMHAREYITTFLILKLIKYLSHFTINCQIYFVPLINPDGVDICINGTKNIKNSSKELINYLLKFTPKSLYKANARGVDINTNFDANWAEGAKNNLIYPWAENFVGFKPNSERETKALINFTKETKPYITISYHSKGEVFYWGYKNQSLYTKKTQKKYIKIIKKTTKYKPIFTRNSSGGYKDYCLLKLNTVGFTIEVGSNKLKHPISKKYLNQIFMQNKDLILNIAKT